MQLTSVFHEGLSFMARGHMGQAFFEVGTTSKGKKNSLCSLVRYIIKGSKKQRLVVWGGGIAEISHKTEGCLHQLKIFEGPNVPANFSHSDHSRKLFYYVDIWYDSVQWINKAFNKNKISKKKKKKCCRQHFSKKS